METIKLIQNNKVIKNVIIVFLGTILLTISAKVKIPFYPVPMTCLLYTSPSPRD